MHALSSTGLRAVELKDVGALAEAATSKGVRFEIARADEGVACGGTQWRCCSSGRDENVSVEECRAECRGVGYRSARGDHGLEQSRRAVVRLPSDRGPRAVGALGDSGGATT